MQMDAGLDTGPMLSITQCPVLPDDTATDLHDRLGTLGPTALFAALTELAAGRAVPVAQPSEGVTYAHKLNKEEARIDWSLDAALLQRRVRAFNPAPWLILAWARARAVLGATALEHTPSAAPGEIVRLDASGLYMTCGTGSLRIDSLQLPGKTLWPLRR